ERFPVGRPGQRRNRTLMTLEAPAVLTCCQVPKTDAPVNFSGRHGFSVGTQGKGTTDSLQPGNDLTCCHLPYLDRPIHGSPDKPPAIARESNRGYACDREWFVSGGRGQVEGLAPLAARRHFQETDLRGPGTHQEASVADGQGLAVWRESKALNRAFVR